MKRVKLFALISLLFIGLGHAWGENATYTKVTSSLADWSGDYLIVYEDGNVAFDGSLTTLDATNNGVAVTISDGSITTDSKYEFHITKDGDVYYIQSASGYYIWGTSSNGLSSNTIKSSAKGNTISFSDGTFTITGSSGTKKLSYNAASDQKRFRYLGTTLIQLYRKTGSSGSVTYTDYLTECPTVVKDIYTISWNANGSVTTTSVTEGDAVELPATPPASCSDTYTHFVGWFTEAAGTDDSPSNAPQGTQVTAATVPAGNATYYAVFSDAQLSEELALATTLTDGDNIYLATSPTGTGVTGANSNNKDATVSTAKAAWMSFTVTNYADGTFQLKNGTNYVSCAASVFTLAATGTSLTLNENGYFTFTSATTTYCLMQNTNNGTFYRCNNVSNIGTANYTQFFMYKSGTPATGYISSCCSDAAVVTIAPASSTLNIGADGNATTTVTCSKTGGGTGAWTYSVSPAGATFDGTTFTATKAGTYTLTATYTENCGKSAKTTITVTKKPTLYFTTEPDNPIVFDDPKCGGNTPLTSKKSVALKGYNLTGDVTVTVIGDYKIARTASASLGNYTTSLTLDKTAEGKINDNYQTIYILSTPPAAKTDATKGTLTITTEGGNTLTVNLSTPTITCAEYTLTFMDRGGKYTTVMQYAGTDVYEPDAPTGVCTEPINYVFDGWAEEIVTKGSTSYTKVTFPYTMPAKDTELYAVYKYVEDGNNQEVTFNASDISNLTEVSSLSWKENTSNVTLTLSDGQRYTSGTPNTFTVTSGNTNYFEVTSNSDIQKIVVEISEAKYTLNTSKKDNDVIVTTADANLIQTLTVTTPKKSVKGYALASYQTRMKRITVTCGTTLYTTSPACGPHVGVSGDVRITSAKGVRVDAYTKISVRATNLDKNTGGDGGAATAVSIKAESNNANFKIKRWGTTGDGYDAYSDNNKSWAFATNITAANYEDSLCITYTPTASNTTESATITLTAYKYNGTTPYATNTITVQGHSLPERFVIAAKSETGWVALPNTLGSSSSATVPNAEDISNVVDPSDNPTKLTTAPSNVIYRAAARANADKNNSQTGLRFTVDGTQFLRASKSGTTVWLTTDNSQDMQSWTLRTEDFVNYQARLDSAVAGRYLAYYKDENTERIGHYKATTPIRFLPFDEECTRLLAPTNLKVTQVKSSAITLTWDAVTGATGYVYSTDSGTNWTEMGNVLTYIITGLTAETPYTIWVKGVVPVGDTDCSYYGTVSATTTNCDDVPYDISYTSDVNSITLSWTMTAKTATVRVYSNDAGTTQVGSFEGKSSPYKITGLTKATTYYVKILADGLCPSELVEVSTERPQLDVVEWKTDGIDVAINTNEKISVVLENQVTKGSGTGLIADELFFSKYFEATGNVKLVAVYNGTGHDVDVTNYTIKYGKTGWESGYIKLGNFTKVQNTMAAGEEVILYSKGNADEDNVIMDCVSTAYPGAPWQQVTNGKSGNSGGNGLLSFAGDKTIALYNGTTLLDVIGAITAGGSPTNTGTSMKIPSWGDAKGWTCDTGLSIEDGTEIGISTNRCLLVRKNTVKSGANAVTRNTADFATLCDEWLGQHVPDNDADNGVQASCDNFAYVGTFDYSGYYTTYDSLVSVEFDNSKRNPDGTLTIEIPRMDTLACKGLKIIAADEGGNVLTTKDYKVPILVTRNATTADNTFFHFGGDTCKTCDVVIRNNATLTKAADGKDQVRDVMVYEGSSLKVNGGTSFTVNSLSLRRKEDVVSTMDVDVAGTLNINSTSDKPVYLDMRITAENWHWFTLPYDCAISDVTWSNGQPAKYGTEWFLMYYDGARRATGVDSGNWKEYEGTTIAAGKGFIIGIKGDGNDKHAYELRFPMAKEVITNDATNKNVEVYAYGAGTEVRPNHKGWNLVGNPYLNYYKKGNINSFNGLRLGLLDYDTDTGWWSVSATDNSTPYIVIPQDFGWSAYKQVLVSSQDLLPFTSYFIQVGKDEGYDDGQKCEVQFDKDKRGKSPKAALMKSAAEEAEEEPVITGIVLRNAQGEQDETSLVIAERFGSSYEMGADFFKWFGDYYKYYTLPVLYSIGDDGGKRAFNAVNEEGAKQSIPLGMYAARDGQYTFSLNTRSDLSRVDKVWLYDAESGRYTDLLREDYTFATTRTEGSGRFFLSVALKEKEITTSAANARYGDLTLYADKQTLVVRGLPEAAEVWVYDPSGKLLHHEQTRHYERPYEVPQQGTYLVRVESKDGGVTLRGVCR